MGNDGMALTKGQCIELLGRPGSGKTFVHQSPSLSNYWLPIGGNRHSESQETRLTHAPMRAGTRWRVNLFCADPVLGMLSYTAVATRRGVRLRNLTRVVHVQRASGAISGMAGRRALIDEGPVHGLFIAMYGTRPTTVSTFVLRRLLRRLAAHVDRYIFVNVPREVCVARCLNRDAPSSRFSARSTSTDIDGLRMDQVYDHVITVLKCVASNKVTEVASAAGALEVLIGPGVERERCQSHRTEQGL